MGRDNIEIRISLEVKTFRAGYDLCEQYIRANDVDVMHACSIRDPTIDGLNREASGAKHLLQGVDLTMIGAEDEFLTELTSTLNGSYDFGEFCGALRRSRNLEVAGEFFVELDVRVHEGGVNARLSATDESGQCVGCEEARV